MLDVVAVRVGDRGMLQRVDETAERQLGDAHAAPLLDDVPVDVQAAVPAGRLMLEGDAGCVRDHVALVPGEAVPPM